MFSAMSRVILETAPLGLHWPSLDPFLFCAYHKDDYPRGNAELGPDSRLLAGRKLGMDFEVRDGFRMYHGTKVPGFPSHPHRGFETVTLVRRGYCDHADSLGAAARFGAGDVQWLTTGGGIVHSEMFPLLSAESDNPLELFQIWLNLPREEKMVPAHFSILWSQDIPRVEHTDAAGRRSTITIVAGRFEGRVPPAPPPHSWAARPSSDVAIWTLDLEPGARLCLPPSGESSHRALYLFRGGPIGVAEESLAPSHVAVVQPDVPLELQAGSDKAELLLLAGRPIGEPVAQHGPFVMNTRAELMTAFEDYQRTGFGGWPWPTEAPVHAKAAGRFAVHADGRREEFPR